MTTPNENLTQAISQHYAKAAEHRNKADQANTRAQAIMDEAYMADSMTNWKAVDACRAEAKEQTALARNQEAAAFNLAEDLIYAWMADWEKAHPGTKLEIGYIGNVWPDCDDRLWHFGLTTKAGFFRLVGWEVDELKGMWETYASGFLADWVEEKAAIPDYVEIKPGVKQWMGTRDEKSYAPSDPWKITRAVIREGNARALEEEYLEAWEMAHMIEEGNAMAREEGGRQ